MWCWRRTSTWPGGWAAFWRRPARAALRPFDLVYGGTLAEAKTELVRNAAIAGLLAGSENVNRINAAAVAEERGIRVHEEKQESHRGGAATVLTIELHTAKGESRASATVIHGEQPRLLEFDGIDIALVVAHVVALHPEDDVFGDVGGVVGHALQAAADHQRVQGLRGQMALSSITLVSAL
jgi:D-3-phosphoglycerate dehydrogenase